MKKYFLLLQCCIAISSFLMAQSVGIGTTTPNATALLHVDLATSTTKGLLITGKFNNLSGTLPDLGAGSRLMFYPGKAAFRVGEVDGTEWDNASVGTHSMAFGLSNIASGISSAAIGEGTQATGKYSLAMGSYTFASGDYSVSMGFNTYAEGSTSTSTGIFTDASGYNSTAMGIQTKAIGQSSIAMGSYTTAGNFSSAAIGTYTIASGYSSVAMGDSTTASGTMSTAIGDYTIASGYSSTAMGYSTTASGTSTTATGTYTTASGYSSVAMGYNTTASGDQSFALGTNVSTNGKRGSFFLGDSDPHSQGLRIVGSLDQFVGRFNGGYYLISSNAGADIGVQVPAGSNSWSVISDVRRKENFLPVDGESVLQKIGAMNLTTWNYKAQDPKTFRHYGPMAQDFYAAFGKDAMGTIGCDTLINQQDLLGVNLIAVQALEKRTATLNDENTLLKNEVAALKSRLDELEKKIQH